jgi:hypothetical protein
VNLISDLAATIAKQGAPTLGALIGTAIGGPAGTAIGGLAGKALETLADSFGTEAEPEAIAEAIKADPKAAEKIAAAEAAAPDMVRVWEASIARAAKNDEAEAEQGFGAWQTRRTVTTYAVLAMLVASFAVALAGASGLIKADTALVMQLVGHAVTLFMAWNGLVSGGRAVTDAIKAATGGKAGK